MLLRQLPGNAIKFYGEFVLCHNDPCLRPWCTFAHSKLELKVWNTQKQDILDRKLY